MIDLINLFDSELRAMAYVQMELWEKLHKQKYHTKNGEMIRDVLHNRLGKMVEATTEMQEFITRLKEFDDFEMGYGLEVGEIVKREMKEGRGS